MSALLPAEVERFGKLLGRLGSDFDGERASAALKATEFLRARQLGWCDVTEQLKRPPVVVTQPAPVPIRPHQQLARRCLGSTLVVWKDYERKFLREMSERLSKPTDKQLAWLEALVDRLARKAREAANGADF